jgi:capsid protein
VSALKASAKTFQRATTAAVGLSLLEERDTYKVLQRFFIENFHQQVFEGWLDMAVLSGELSLPGYETNPDRYKASRWIPRSWEWVDPQREVSAYKDAVRCGFKTLGQVISEQGGDIDDVLIARQAELAMLDEMGIVLDTDPSEVNAGGGTQPQPVPDTEMPVEEEVEDEEEEADDGDD